MVQTWRNFWLMIKIFSAVFKILNLDSVQMPTNSIYSRYANSRGIPYCRGAHMIFVVTLTPNLIIKAKESRDQAFSYANNKCDFHDYRVLTKEHQGHFPKNCLVGTIKHFVVSEPKKTFFFSNKILVDSTKVVWLVQKNFCWNNQNLVGETRNFYWLRNKQLMDGRKKIWFFSSQQKSLVGPTKFCFQFYFNFSLTWYLIVNNMSEFFNMKYKFFRWTIILIIKLIIEPIHVACQNTKFPESAFRRINHNGPFYPKQQGASFVITNTCAGVP